MTGQYAHSRFVPAIEWRMSPAESTIADYCNDAGYHTCYIGKWHLYGGHGVLPDHNSEKVKRTPIPRPHRGRWQKWLGFDLCNDPWDSYYFEDDDPTPRKIEGYQTDGLTDLAIDYLCDRKPEDDPFCCVLSVEPPHFPMAAPQELERKWLNTDIKLPDNFMTKAQAPAPGNKSFDPYTVKRHIQIYYALLENFDDNVGRVMKTLRETGQIENTVVLLLADHGEMQGAHGELAHVKDHPYEESVGIPLIINDPRQSDRAGTVHDAPTCMEDVLPTILGLLGVDVPGDLPGEDLSPLIRGEAQKPARPGVMLEFVHDYRQRDTCPYGKVFWRAFRSERYKYTVLGGGFGSDPWQFFDLQEDPLEMNNLIHDPAHQDLIAQHHGWLYDRLLETADHFVLKPAFGYEGVNDWREQEDQATARQ